MDYFPYKKRIRLLLAKKKWKHEFGGDLHFSHGLSNSCGDLIAFYGNQDITVKKKLADKKRRVLVLDTRNDGSDILLINIYNANTEKEQVSVLNKLTAILFRKHP